mgnify:CR=1 FL=1
MKAIVKRNRKKGFVLSDSPVPPLKPGQVLIKTVYAGICGTDVHIYRWDEWAQKRIHPPVIGGHEFMGVIEKVSDDVTYLEPGARVSAEGHITCGHCKFCRTGQGHICQNVKIIGVDIDGAFAEYIAMPAENVWPVPNSIPDRFAAVFDPLGNAMHTVMEVPISGRSVLITGCGAIGLFAVSIALAAGASRVIVSEPNTFKRRLAKKAGDIDVIDPAEQKLPEAVRDLTDGLGPEVVLEMSGNPGALTDAFKAVQNGGHVVILGIPAGTVCVNWAEDIIFKGITINAVNGRRMYDTWYQCQNFLKNRNINISHILTHEFPAEDFEKGFDVIENGEAAKVLLSF